MDNFWSSLRQAFGHLGTIRVMDIVDILLVAAFFYFLITLVRRTKTNKLFQGIVYILLALWLSGEMQLYTVNYILRNAVQVGLLALVVLFQPEIRRFLEKLGTGSIFSRLLGAPHTLNADAAITQTVLACVDMSATRTGALIIFERDNRLDDQIRTGTILDAETTAELLKNIFYPKAPLHDGAAIIRSGRIQAAGCMLPLSNNPNLSKELGMRHRAGIGMSEAFLAHIFDPFSQEHIDARSMYHGTGLGMSIVKSLIDKMGGSIEVSSREGEGSEFVITLPFEMADAVPEAQEQAEPEKKADVRGLHLLLAEDNELNAEILHQMLEEAGVRTTMVANGKEAVNTFEYSSIGTYDYILMDIMMPEMDGYEASRQIRAINRPDAKTVPIIALTANAFTEDAQRAAEAGMDAHMTKPFDFDKLKKCMSEIKQS